MSSRKPQGEKRAAAGSRTRRWLVRIAQVVAVTVTLGACFAAGAWLTLTRSVRVPDVTVPDLVDLDRLEAARRLRDLGLSPEIGSERPDPLRPAGSVLEQVPAAGSRTRPGRAVRLVVSSGAQEARFPDVVGSSLRRAQIALRKAGFTVSSVASAPHPDVAVGRVVAQHPGSGETGFPGQGLSLLLSAGPQERAFVMPSLLERDAGTVRRALEASGFTGLRVSGPADGVVTDQQPRPGHRVTTQAGIVITTSARAARGAARNDAARRAEP